MKSLIIVGTLILVAGCTSIQDPATGKQVGTCFGAPCLLRAAVGRPMTAADIGYKAPASAPAATLTHAEQAAATTAASVTVTTGKQSEQTTATAQNK